jgi:hypothetical protein
VDPRAHTPTVGAPSIAPPISNARGRSNPAPRRQRSWASAHLHPRTVAHVGTAGTTSIKHHFHTGLAEYGRTAGGGCTEGSASKDRGSGRCSASTDRRPHATGRGAGRTTGPGRKDSARSRGGPGTGPGEGAPTASAPTPTQPVAPGQVTVSQHRKKRRLPGIRRTRAGLDLRCRP